MTKRQRRAVLWGVAVLVATGGVLLGLRGLAEVRIRSKAAICYANLRGIGQSLAIYQEREGDYPPTLMHLVDSGAVSKGQLLCAMSRHHADGHDTRSYTEQRQPYVYVPGIRPSDPDWWIHAYDDPAVHHCGYGSILRKSGDVQPVGPEEFRREWQRFAEAYEAVRGKPPRTIPAWTMEEQAQPNE